MASSDVTSNSMLWALLLSAAACQPAVAPDEVVLDRALFSLDHATPSSRFVAGEGSLLLGEGWAPNENRRSQTRRRIHFARIVGRSATVFFERPLADEIDFFARCRPLGPTQTLEVAVRGMPIGRIQMEEGWQEIRVPISAAVLGEGLNELQLDFGYPGDETEIGTGSGRGAFSAACRFVAVVPRSLDSPEDFLATARLDTGSRLLRLPLGGAATFALPVHGQIRLHVEVVRVKCAGCQLHAEMLTGGEALSVWQGRLDTAVPISAELPRPPVPGDRLRLRLSSKAGKVFDARQIVDLRLPVNFLDGGRLESSEAGRRPHIFIYTIDTLRADILSADGFDPEVTPRIAQFATEAVHYRNAWSASAWTLPSVVSILTGTYPFRHHVMKGDVKFSTDSPPSLAQLVSDAGYDTLGLSQSFVVGQRFGVDTGFERFLLRDQLGGSETTSQELRRLFFIALATRRHPDRPLFVYLHAVDPHSPYRPTGEDRRFAAQNPGELDDSKYRPHIFIDEGLGAHPADLAHLRALYAGELAYSDRHFGRFLRLLEYLDLYDDSLIILVSDHGEEFREHGGWDHGRTMYEELLRVPLIVKYPRSAAAGTVISERVSTVDIVPTALRVAGIDSGRARFDGRSLRPSDLEALSDGQRIVFAEVNPEKSAFAETVDYRAIARGDLKCIESLLEHDQFGRPIPRWQVFDLGNDPTEQRPLDLESDRARRCASMFEQWLDLQRLEPTGPASESTDRATLERLRALGYVE